jgi:VPDSG-CTERM motif
MLFKFAMKITRLSSNNLVLVSAVVCAVMLAFSPNASAHMLDPFQFFTNGPIGNPSQELNYLQTHGGGSYQPTFLPATSQFLGKFEDDGSIENGAINISTYATINMVSGNTWDISWNLTGSGFTLDGLLIKDGNVQGLGMLYRFYGVSADEALIGSGTVTFDDPVKDISHISFFGSPGGQVPDGGATVMLLGAALCALGTARRFLKR